LENDKERERERERERVCLFEGNRYSQNAKIKIKSAKNYVPFMRFSIAIYNSTKIKEKTSRFLHIVVVQVE
jgi:hypothetical protein